MQGECSGSENGHRPNSPARGPRSDLLVDGVEYDTTGPYRSLWQSDLCLTRCFALHKALTSRPCLNCRRMDKRLADRCDGTARVLTSRYSESEFRPSYVQL